MNESMNDKAVYRTAPATPGLLKMSYLPYNFCLFLFYCDFEEKKYVFSKS